MVVRISHYKRHINGRLTDVGGYTRSSRPASKKKIVDKSRAYYPVRDEFGQIKGYVRRRR